MWRKTGLIATYIISIFSIIWTIAAHINYTEVTFKHSGLLVKAAEPLVQQHLYTTILIVCFFISITALITYVLRPKNNPS